MAASGAPRSVLEFLDEKDTIERKSRRTRLQDLSSSLLEQYAELLKSGQVFDDVRQQTSELRTSVLAASVVQGTDNMMQLTDEVRRATIIGDHETIAEEVMAVASTHRQFSDDGQRRLRRVASEMRSALRELEESYYS